jgi:hypothetical protein
MPSKTVVATNQATMEIVRVRARVNRFLLSQVGSHFAAGEPKLDAAKAQWLVPILMITPGLIVGETGEAIVEQQTREIISHTPIEQLYAAAKKLREQHHAEIEAAFLQARKV